MSPVDWASLNSIHDANGNIYDTDWIDNAIDDGALTTSHNLSFAGGSKTSTYVISGGYTGQDGVIGGKDVSYYKRYNFRANSEHKMYDGLITVGEHVSFVWKDSRNMGTGNIYNNNLRSAFSASPIMPVYGPDGGYYDTTGSDWNVNDGNPYGTMMVNRYNRSRSGNLDANAYMQVEPIKNLKFKTVFAVGYGASDYRSYTPAYSFSPQSGQTEESVRQSNGHGLSMVWTTPCLTTSPSRVATTSVPSWVRNGRNMTAAAPKDTTRASYPASTTGTTPGSPIPTALPTNRQKGAPYDPVRSMSYFARLGWSWKDRYMVNATLRADGSSKFAPGNRWGYFPSVSAGWTVSEEDFMKSARSWMDFLKLRVSWGQVGNANINCWQYLAPVTTTNVNYNFGTNGGQEGWSTGSYPSRLANEDVKWETSEQINIGIDARFLSSRLALTADWYVKSTKDWLVQAPVLATAGTAGPIINGGDVKNTGVELGLTWNDNIGRDFTYSVGANFAYNHNEVGSIPTEDGIIHGNTNQIYQNAEEFYRAENGHAIGYFWGYRTAGIFQSKQDIDSWIAAGNGVMQANVQPGDVKYVDINRDGMIDAKDKTDLGNGLPKYTFGFNIMLGWKGFDLGLNATGAAGFKIAQSYRNPNAAQANYSRSILDRWTGEGTSNKMPRVTYNDVGNWLFSDLYLQDGDYIRLQNLTLGYDFKRLIAWKGISRLRLYLQAQNLLTLTKYDGMDPEVGSYNGTDANHVNSDGSTTQTWVSGVDMGYYPHPRTFIVGVNIAF